MPLCLINAEIDAQFWRSKKSRHFIVYHQEIPYGYVDKFISKAENYYTCILDNLDFRGVDFWNWDNRAKKWRIYYGRD
ncbi:MAG: hypothetical protein NC916_00685 [Candidatus Omnitrophica bacterium]|nr:hypothetical protein [Candidatus Omnitrophota bacterium]